MGTKHVTLPQRLRDIADDIIRDFAITMRSRTIKAKLNTLLRAVRAMDYSVKFAPGKSEWDGMKKIIRIGTVLAKHQIYALAHELGHAKIYSSSKQHGILPCETGSYATLETEFNAWKAADSMIYKLGLYDDDYIVFKHKHLRSYYRKDS